MQGHAVPTVLVVVRAQRDGIVVQGPLPHPLHHL